MYGTLKEGTRLNKHLIVLEMKIMYWVLNVAIDKCKPR